MLSRWTISHGCIETFRRILSHCIDLYCVSNGSTFLLKRFGSINYSNIYFFFTGLTKFWSFKYFFFFLNHLVSIFIKHFKLTFSFIDLNLTMKHHENIRFFHVLPFFNYFHYLKWCPKSHCLDTLNIKTCSSNRIDNFEERVFLNERFFTFFEIFFGHVLFVS